MRPARRVVFELFGVPRLRAGAKNVEVRAASIAEALRELSLACPSLVNVVLFEGRLHPAYRLNLNGERFLSSGPELDAVSLSDGDCLLLLAADVGG